ncbi:hypothetical protein CR513_07902, partial [Mucuna pruriens]
MDEVSTEYECHNVRFENVDWATRQLVNQLQAAGSGNLPSQPILNPKGGNNYKLHHDYNRTRLILNPNQKLTPEYNNRLRPPYNLFLLGPSQPRNLKLMKIC